MLIWTGTATVTNGDATVVVDTGAALTAEVVAYGAMVVLDGVVYFADSLTDTTTLEMTRVYAGSTGTVDMELWPVSQDTTNLVNLAQIVARTQAQINILDKNSQGLFFNMKGVTGAADPGPGFIAFDDDDATLVTEAYVDALDANGRTVSELIALWETGTVLVVRSLTTTAYRAYEVETNTSNSGWSSISLAYVGHDGVLADNEALTISWSRVGEGLEIDAVGTFSSRSTYNTAAAGFVYLSTNGNGSSNLTPSIYRKASATSGDWSPQFPFQGPQGYRGWSPVFAVVSDGTRRVLRLVDYVGGEGAKPTSGINQYVSAGGLTGTIGSATDIRGSTGLSAYEVAVVNGFSGTQSEWLATLVGASAYQVAVADGFVGAEEEWLASLNGADGTDPGILLTWDDATTDADPGSGSLRADAANLAEAASLFVSKINRSGDNLAAYFEGLGASSSSTKGQVILTNAATGSQAVFDAISVVDAATYMKIGVSNPAGATAFIDADAISFQFLRTGDAGDGDLNGPATSAVGNLATFGNTTGDQLEDSGIPVSDVGLFVQTLTFFSHLALEQAEDRSTGPVQGGTDGSGLFDGFNVLTYVDVAGATNLDTSSAGELKPTSTLDSDSSAAATGTSNFNNFLIGDRSWQLDNGKTVTKIGLSRSAAMTNVRVCIVLRNSAGNYDVVSAYETFDHPGGGWYDHELATPIVIPASGQYLVAFHSPSGASPWDIRGTTARFYVSPPPLAPSTGQTLTEDTGNAPVTRAVYAAAGANLTVESEALALTEDPDWGFVAAFIDPAGAGMNTDIVVGITRDGADFATLTMQEGAQRPDGSKIYQSGIVDLTTLAAGATGAWRIQTLNGYVPVIKAVGVAFGVN